MIGVPLRSYSKQHINELDDFDPLFLEVVENFFQHYKELEGKKVELKGWIGKEDTFKIVEESVCKGTTI